MSVYDRWHLAHPPDGAKRCSAHRKVPSAEHGTGLRFQVRGMDADRKPVRRSFAYEQDALDFDATLRASVLTGTYIDDQAGKVKLAAYAEQWRRQQTHGHATAERIERMLRLHVYPVIGDYPIAVLSRRVSIVRDWIAGLDLEPSSSLLLIDRLSAIFEAALDDRIIGRNPLHSGSVTRPKHVRSEVVPWTPGQVGATCAALPGRLQALGYLGAVTGPRQGELLGLAVTDIDWLRKTVRYEVQVAYVGGRHVYAPVKNRKPREVPIADNVLPVLARHVELYPPVAVTLPWSERKSRIDGKPVTRELIFTSPNGSPWWRQEVNRAWRPAWQSAGVPDRGRKNGMHVLRHSAASRWLSKGLNPAKVAAYLGDTLSVVVSTYLHFLPDDEEVGRAIMDGYLDPEILPCGTQKRPENALARAR